MKPALILAAAFYILIGSAPKPLPAYSLVKTASLGAPDRWDYVVYDPGTRRVYIAHADHLEVVDARSGDVVAQVMGIPGRAHGIVIAGATGLGFTDDGTKGEAVAFDLQTLRVTDRIAVKPGADAVGYDGLTKRVFVVEAESGTISVIDARTHRRVGAIAAGEELEYAVGDAAGTLYVAGEEKSDVLKIDARSNRIDARWRAINCVGPHGLALDRERRRLFVGCENRVMLVIDAASGRVINRLPIGAGSDAIAFDPVRKRVFSSNGSDGTVTGYQCLARNRFAKLPEVRTAISARTMATDPSSGRLFVVGADTDAARGGGTPLLRPGSLRLMIFEPVSR
jgi:DNA-binding beta-propeller fold protein YncE